MATSYLLSLWEQTEAGANYSAEMVAENTADWSRVVLVTQSLEFLAFVAGSGANEHNGNPGKGSQSTPKPQRGPS
jgi:hypothetical protein